MSTVRVLLSESEYVKVNSDFNPITLHAHRDSVRVVLSELKPTVGNVVFHLLSSADIPLQFNSIDTNVWALATSVKSSLIVSQTSPINVALHDGEGNAIESLSSALKTYDGHIHNRVLNESVHTTDDTVSTTFAVASLVNDHQIQITDATGFNVLDYLHINTTVTEITHPQIISSVPALPTTGPVTLTLDRRLDRGHLIGDVITKSMTNLSGSNASVSSPMVYSTGPTSGEVWVITRLLFKITHDAASDFGKFAGAPALTNGVVVRVLIGGVYRTFSIWKDNGDMKVDMFNVVFDSRSSGNGVYGTSGRITFLNTGGVVRLNGDTNDEFQVITQDVMTGIGIIDFRIKVQGHVEGP